MNIPGFGFYNMDCMEGMKLFPDKYFDLAIVDPPYGLNITGRHKAKEEEIEIVNGKARAFGGKKGGIKLCGQCENAAAKPKVYHPFNDQTTPGKEYFDELFRVSKNQIIWGGNYFLDYLGNAKCVIVWDKCRRGLSQSDCEVAWTSLNDNPRIIEYKWNGMLQQDMKNKETRIHPTQKPVALYEKLLTKYAKDGDVILDTHVGSASSLIACHNTQHKFVGFEIDEYYFNVAKERFDAETRQINLFECTGDK